MKKLLLLMAAGFVATSSFAQSAKTPVVLKDVQSGRGVSEMIGNTPKLGTSYSANKGTVGGSRWLEPWALNQAYNGNTAFPSTFVYYIGYDSTYLQTYGNGPGPVNYASFGQFFDPIYSEGFNFIDPNFFTADDINVTLGNDYTVDSIYFAGAYIIGNVYPNGIDTLIISAAPIAYADDAFRPNPDYDVNLLDYEDVQENDSVLLIQKFPGLNKADRSLSASGAVTWKVALEDTLRKAKTATGFPTRTFSFAVNNGAGLNVAKGRGFGFSVSYKPGQAQQAPNADSVSDYNYMMVRSVGRGAADLSPYYRYSYSDRNMSYWLISRLLHTQAGRWLSPVELELYNGADVQNEMIVAGAKITCATCQTLGIKDVNNTFKKVAAYPNPANVEVRVPFILNVNSDVTVTLTNAMGQVVKSQNFKNVNNAVASFNTADLATGVYIYTVIANGQRESGRISVSK